MEVVGSNRREKNYLKLKWIKTMDGELNGVLFLVCQLS